MNKIEHVVLLMLENRSFDSMLGWLYEKGRPAKNYPKLRQGERAYEGLQGLNLQAYENVDATGKIKASPIRGAKGLNVPNTAPGETFAQVTTQLSMIEMTPGGILVAGKWRTQDDVNKALEANDTEGLRNTLIVELSGHTNQSGEYFQGKNNDELVGMGAVVVFLRATGIRDDSALKNMSADQQLNTLISELANKTANVAPQVSYSQLKAMSRQKLVQLGLERFAKPTMFTPTMKGYVRDYTDLMRHHKYKEDDVKRYAEQVMQSYTPDQLPVLNGLAEHYAVCDMWFSSVPSQTNPNRAFAFCGTSMGLVDNGFLEEDPRAAAIEDFVEYKLGDDRFHAKTIFNALADDGKTTWKIFRQSGYLQKNIHKAVDALRGSQAGAALWLAPWVAFRAYLAAKKLGEKSFDYLKELSSSELVSDYTHRLFPEIHKIKDADTHFTKLANLDEFHGAARAGQLPNFTYIQPEWTIGERGTGLKLGKGVLFHQGDDYHPPGNLDAGENLVKQIYNSLISNRAAWEKTLLIITFDEPIGSFDHYPPPAAVPPWGKGTEPAFKRQYNFNFDRYGGRVPAILVSPLVEKSTVFRSTTSVPFDHTSIIATILKWRGLENKDFGERTKQAPTFENIVSLSTPRKDEKEVRFLKLSHKAGEPVRFYDRFNLRDSKGKYISGFREHDVFPGSIFAEDPTLSEYFPIQAIKNPIEMTPGGILVAGKWRTKDDLKNAKAEDIRNTLIVELSGHTNQPGGYFQGKNNDELVGKGAVVVFLRNAGILDDAKLKTMSDDDQRNTLIVENSKRYTDRTIPQLQSMSNQDLVKMGLQWFHASQFYLQNANNRPDSGEISTGGGTEVRLIATDYGLGSYNVLGAWRDSRDCYYFNDYMEGDNSKKETWIISTKGGALSFSSTGSLRFGDKVFIQNKYFEGERLAPDSLHHDYLTTNKSDAYWTIEPILEDT